MPRPTNSETESWGNGPRLKPMSSKHDPMSEVAVQKMEADGLRLVVIGTSSGGTEALEHLFDRLPSDFRAAILVVRHLATGANARHLAHRLSKSGSFPCAEAKDGEIVQGGRIYIAPADRHLLIDDSKLLVIRGARENRWRPAIDPLFRSAAVSYRNRAIGVILTGLLDDGVAGLAAVKACGGTTIVQDPADAAYPDLPANVLRNVEPDHCLPLCGIAAILGQLVTSKPSTAPVIPKDIATEARIAKQVLTGPENVDPIGDRTEITCPDCGGVLWQVEIGGTRHYRCHTGHVFDPGVLLFAQSGEIEKTLWVALRLFEERRNLLLRMKATGGYFDARSLDERIADTNSHIQRIRSLFGEL